MNKAKVFAVAIASATVSQVCAQSMDDFSMRHDAEVTAGLRHGKSRPVREIAVGRGQPEKEEPERPVGGVRPESVPDFVDQVLQDWGGGNLMLGGEAPALGHGFDGVTTTKIPLDANGDVDQLHTCNISTLHSSSMTRAARSCTDRSR